MFTLANICIDTEKDQHIDLSIQHIQWHLHPTRDDEFWLILSRSLDLGYLQGYGTPTKNSKHFQALSCVYLLVSEKMNHVSWNWLRQHTACQFHILPYWFQLSIRQVTSKSYFCRSHTNDTCWTKSPKLFQNSRFEIPDLQWTVFFCTSHSLVPHCKWQSHAEGGGFDTSFSQSFNAGVCLPDIPFDP